MSADLLRRAAQVEREEWGGETNARMYPNRSALHLALANWLDAIAATWDHIADKADDPDDPADENGFRLEDTLDHHAVIVARHILGEAV
ncbi:hypothetical protein ACFP63_08730 [Oerskovia jenensis]|uniref:dATP/dGTP diphosphohydrolase N-terminal domain-containing protein n=1 Tax=Oerskovia jenensis TaxID=162169 RepID=A0ABS2LIP4_9CELL|nr:hypothetical protein [Oerskovia jenensis]MBM7480137.1 hypothetical protein [Oerskovia jenensis]